MQPLKNTLAELSTQLAAASERLQLEAKERELESLDDQLAEADVWRDPTRAEQLSKQAASLRQQIEPWQLLNTQVADSVELLDLGDESMLPELTDQVEHLEAEYRRLKKDLLFHGEFDDHAAILKLSAGAGGTDAQDWTEMLERMYLRWAEKSGMKTELIERSTGEEAGSACR